MQAAKASKDFTFTRRVDYTKFYISLVEALSPLKRMSAREAEVIAAFVAYSDHPTPRFSTPYRRKVREELGISESQLSNILKSLKGSGVLSEDSVGEMYLHPAYVPPPHGVELALKLIPSWE